MLNSNTENVKLESYSEYFRVFMTRLEVENDTFYDQSVSFCLEVIKIRKYAFNKITEYFYHIYSQE